MKHYKISFSTCIKWSFGIIWMLAQQCIPGCTKIVSIGPPKNSITTVQVFTDSADAAAAIAGIYSNTLYPPNGIGFCNGAESVYCGMSADELIPFFNSGDPAQFYANSLYSNNGSVYGYFWGNAYPYIYQANASIEGLQASNSLSESVKKQFSGEAKFLRDLYYFYLVNLFGDVPYVTSSSWEKTSLSYRTSTSEIYQKIIAELKEVQGLLSDDYHFSNGLRTRANRWAATALLARVYLYTGDWASAETTAGSIIDQTALFQLAPNVDSIFSCNNSEAILQWQLNTSFGNFTATPEGSLLVPPDQVSSPNYYMSDELLAAFDPLDLRKKSWIDSTTYSGITYYTPNKYKIGVSQYVVSGTATEYPTVLRLAEQYLVRAEARAHEGKLNDAVDDINIIRTRAGLPNLPYFSDQNVVLDAVAKERQIELFAEWGHRWFDLKRTGQIDAVMSVVTPQKIGGVSWNSYQQLYPIPRGEMYTDPNLVQNPGY